MGLNFDPGEIIEMLSIQKGTLDRVQDLLNHLYPGLKAQFSFAGLDISGPKGQMERLQRDIDAYEAKKKGEKPGSEH
jgi:hypothetical protein